MLPTLLVCSALMGKCFEMSIERVEPSYTVCEQRIEHVVVYMKDQMRNGKIAMDAYIDTKKCVAIGG